MLISLEYATWYSGIRNACRIPVKRNLRKKQAGDNWKKILKQILKHRIVGWV
jgi:hypothetical protein